MTQEQMEECAVLLTGKYDDQGDGVMNFEEFFVFYREFLTSDAAVHELWEWIKARFLTEEEKKQKEEAEELAKELEKRKQEQDVGGCGGSEALGCYLLSHLPYAVRPWMVSLGYVGLDEIFNSACRSSQDTEPCPS
jgi:hypothetical protein